MARGGPGRAGKRGGGGGPGNLSGTLPGKQGAGRAFVATGPICYQHEPVDSSVDLLFERPGELPVVEIVFWIDCDRLLMPGAQT